MKSIFNLFYLLAVFALFSCQFKTKPIRFSDTLCENEKLLLNGGLQDSVTVFVDLNKSVDDIFKDVIAQRNMDICAGPSLYKANFLVGENDTVQLKALIGEFNFNCELNVIPPWNPRPIVHIGLLDSLKVLVNYEILTIADMDSTISFEIMDYPKIDTKGIYYTLYWSSKSTVAARHTTIKAICKSYLNTIDSLYVSSPKKLCIGEPQLYYPKLLLILAKPIPPPPIPPEEFLDSIDELKVSK